MSRLDKFEQLQNYEAKQRLTGRVFDFKIIEDTHEIFIAKYYDVPNRQLVVIPDFVDKIGGIFQRSRYINKVIMHSNVKGKLDFLFYNSFVSNLDLTEFETININSMSHTFNICEFNSFKIGDGFNTSNVTCMTSMFEQCHIDELDLGNNFNTSKVETMASMFTGSKINRLKLGDKFDTYKSNSFYSMFLNFNTDSLNLGDKFRINTCALTRDMFFRCSAKEITLGEYYIDSHKKRFSRLTDIPIIYR